MTDSERATCRRLPLFYLFVPLSAAVVWLFPYRWLLTSWTPLALLPLWVILGHLQVGAAGVITTFSFQRGRALMRSSILIYGGEGSAIHFQAAFLVALAEEILFRYAALTWLTGAIGSQWGALVIVSLVFSALHLRHGLTFRGMLDRVELLLMGLVTGGLTLGLRSLYPALIVHGMRNYILRCLLISKEDYEALNR